MKYKSSILSVPPGKRGAWTRTNILESPLEFLESPLEVLEGPLEVLENLLEVLEGHWSVLGLYNDVMWWDL